MFPVHNHCHLFKCTSPLETFQGELLQMHLSMFFHLCLIGFDFFLEERLSYNIYFPEEIICKGETGISK